MATPSVLTFDAEGRAVDFEVKVDDLQLFLQCDRADRLSLFDLTSGASPAPPATAHNTVRLQCATRDAAACLAVRRHLPTTERAHFSQYKSAQTLYDAVVARYSSPATPALSRLILPYLYPDLAAFPTVADLITHLRTSDTRYRAALPAEFCAQNPIPPFCPTTLTVDLLEQRLLAAETSIVAVGASRGDPRTPVFEGCSPSPLLPSVASAAAADLGGFESVGAAYAPSGRRRTGRGMEGKGTGGTGGGGGGGGGGSGGGWGGGGRGGGGGGVGSSSGGGGGGGGGGGSGGGGGGRGSGGGGGSGGAGRGSTQRSASGGGQRQQQQHSRETLSPQQLREWYAGRQRGGGTGPCTYVLRTGDRTGEKCGGLHSTQAGVAIFDLDYDAILAAMYAVSTSDEGDCYLCLPPDPSSEAAALGACETAALGASASNTPGAGESALSGTASAKVFHTFTLDSGASRSFFRDRTTLTPLSRPVAVSLADPSWGPVLASFSTVLPCPAAPSGTLSGLYLPSLSTNLVSGADLQDQGVDQFTPASQRVTHCTCARTGRHLATFTHRPGSSLYTLSTESPPVPTSGQVAASSQVFAAASGSGPESAPCSYRLLPHQTLPWHHRLGHPSLPRLRGMASRFLVSGLPRSLPPLPPGPGPTCVPCVEGRQRAAPHSSEFPPTKAPLQTLHMDVWGPARIRGQGHERYFLLVVDDYSRYTTVFPLRSKGDVTEVGGEFSSARLGAFCRAQGICQTFTLPASPQQNGIAERRIGMVMDVARTSMIHAAAPHFLWPFAVQYAAHQLNLQPRVSLPEISPTLRWTGKVGDASAFRVLQRFDFTYSSPQATPLFTRHSLSALPSDESVEPSGPYPELVGCLMYLMTCTRPDLAYPLSILARYVAPGRHRPEHMAAAKRLLRYLCSTSGLGLVLGGRHPVVLTGHADASWADDQATQRSSQGYTFSLGSGSVSWQSTCSSSVLGSSCEAEIYAGAMAAQELRWLTYLLADLGEPPRSPPVLYIDNKAMLALCREHRLEHRTKHIALRYFLARELQQRGQLRLAYVASEANIADVFTKALSPGDHQRFCTMLACFALLDCLGARCGGRDVGPCKYRILTGPGAGSTCWRPDHSAQHCYSRLDDLYFTSPPVTIAIASLSFTMDSGASQCFFRDHTTVTPISALVPFSLAHPTSGPAVARSSTTLPCPAVPLGFLTGLYIPSFSRNLVGVGYLQDRGIIVTFLHMGGLQSVRTLPPGLFLPRLPESLTQDSSSWTLPPPKFLSHSTVLWNHRLGHLSLPHLRNMASQRLVSGLPRVFESLPPSPAPPCTRCVEGRLRAIPHSSSLHRATAPFQTLHLDVWGLAPRLGPEWEPYFLVVVDDYSRYTTVFPLAKKSEVTSTLVWWLLATEGTRGGRVSWDSPTIVWTGSPGVVSKFHVWGCLALVRDTFADKLSARAFPCVFLGFPVDSPYLAFYDPPLHRFLDSCGVRFDKSLSYYARYPCRGLPVPPHPLFLAPSPPPAPAPPVPHPPPGPALSGASIGVARLGGAGAGGAGAGGTGAGGAGTGGASSGGVDAGVPEVGGCGSGSAGTGGAGSEGVGAEGTPTSTPSLPPHRHDTLGAAAGAAGAAVAVAAATTFTAVVPMSEWPSGPWFSLLSSCLLLVSYCVRPHHFPPVSILLLPPELSLTVSSCPITYYYRTAQRVVTHILASLVTDPGASPSSVSALTAVVSDFATTRRLDYATSLVAAPPMCPLSARGEFALGCDVLEDRQFKLEFLAATSPSPCAMLLSP
ncbi:unnamed protein product [Closterium sp. NIES-53]